MQLYLIESINVDCLLPSYTFLNVEPYLSKVNGVEEKFHLQVCRLLYSKQTWKCFESLTLDLLSWIGLSENQEFCSAANLAKLETQVPAIGAKLMILQKKKTGKPD